MSYFWTLFSQKKNMDKEEIWDTLEDALTYKTNGGQRLTEKIKEQRKKQRKVLFSFVSS
jgi:hypothetical protein